MGKGVSKLILIIVGLVLIVSGISCFSDFSAVQAQEKAGLNLYLFYGEGCPHCEKEKEFLEELKLEYADQIQIYQYELYYNPENAKLFNQVTSNLGVDVGGVPFLVVGDEGIIGYGSDSTTGQEIRSRVDYCLQSDCSDTTGDLLSINEADELGLSDRVQGKSTDLKEDAEEDVKSDESTDENDAEIVDVPILGSIDISGLSLPVITVLIAFIDGFNPCAMWILVFLITMLINMKDKKRLYTLGSVFIITSAAVYFVFLAAWFNFFKFIGYVYWIKVVIGIVAVVSGLIHLKDGLSSSGECRVVNADKRKTILDRIRNATQEKSFLLAIIGIITLAVSVNLIEVVCSAGLPSIYTNLLASAELSSVEYYSYLLLYVLIFMLDDLLIFFIAVKSFELAGVATKYTKWSSIVGGIVILIIGLLLIFKPDVLMFG